MAPQPSGRRRESSTIHEGGMRSNHFTELNFNISNLERKQKLTHQLKTIISFTIRTTAPRGGERGRRATYIHLYRYILEDMNERAAIPGRANGWLLEYHPAPRYNLSLGTTPALEAWRNLGGEGEEEGEKSNQGGEG